MKRCVILVTMLVASLVSSGVALGATYDLTGTWNFSNFNHSVTGACPNGTNASGTLNIVQTGDSFTLEFTSGMECDPASMCSFNGTVNGAEYTATNSDVVDNEGGVATNTFVFTASSETEAAGSTVSTYELDDFSCEWNFDVTLTKAGGGPDGGVPDGGGAGGDDGGSSDSDEDEQENGDGGGCSTTGHRAGGLILLCLALIGLLRRK